METGEFSVTRHDRDGVTVVEATGEVDLASSDELGNALREAVGGSERVVLDLSGCPFLDSSGLRALIAARNGAETSGGSFAVVIADPNVLRVIEVASLDRVLEIHPTVAAALA